MPDAFSSIISFSFSIADAPHVITLSIALPPRDNYLDWFWCDKRTILGAMRCDMIWNQRQLESFLSTSPPPEIERRKFQISIRCQLPSFEFEYPAIVGEKGIITLGQSKQAEGVIFVSTKYIPLSVGTRSIKFCNIPYFTLIKIIFQFCHPFPLP